MADHDIVLFIKQNRSFDDGHAKLFSAEAWKKYDGTIIGITECHVMQASINSPNQVIIHDRHSLSRMPDMDKRVEISYALGSIGLVREPETMKETCYSKSHDLEKDSHQYERER